jgi:hypothetical protein
MPYVNKKIVEGKVFYYCPFGSETHGTPSFILWVSSKLVEKDEEGRDYLKFPAVNAKIIKTDKGNYVLKKIDGWITYNVGVRCGYRGSSSYKLINPIGDEIQIVYRVYESPRGNLGISKYGIISTRQDPLRISYERTGRLYGEPDKGILIYYSDGRIEEITDIDDEDLNELKNEIDE